MTFIAAGTAIAAGVGLGSGALAVAAGTAVAAGAAGAGLGAIGAAATGGDIGKGALMGGVGGAVGGAFAPVLGAAGLGGGMASNIAAGGIAGAAGGAAGNAAGGEDIGKGALIGGVMGGIGGAMKGVTPAEEIADSNMIKASSKAGIASRALDNSVVAGVPTESTINANMAAQQNLASAANTASNVGQSAPVSMSNLGKYVAANPMSAVKAGAPMLIQGAMNGQGTPEKRAPIVIPSIGGAPLSKDFVAPPPITRDTMNRYYADGGEVAPQPQQPINKFAQMGLDMAQQQAAQQQQAPQGIAQLQPQGYAKGGLLEDVPGSGMLKSIYNSSIGNMVAPDLGNKLFASSTPDTPVANAQQGENSNDDFMRQVQQNVQRLHQAQMQQNYQAQMQQNYQAQPQQQTQQYQPQMYANGGITGGDNLGGYSHGGIAGLTRGPGDGVSDSIPAQIGNSGKQPARLADGEFVIPARAVSELGNGSTEAGAKHLQAMVDKVQARRSKTTGKGKIAVDSKARKSLLA